MRCAIHCTFLGKLLYSDKATLYVHKRVCAPSICIIFAQCRACLAKLHAHMIHNFDKSLKQQAKIKSVPDGFDRLQTEQGHMAPAQLPQRGCSGEVLLSRQREAASHCVRRSKYAVSRWIGSRTHKQIMCRLHLEEIIAPTWSASSCDRGDKVPPAPPSASCKLLFLHPCCLKSKKLAKAKLLAVRL